MSIISYCKYCSYASWTEESTVVCTHEDVYNLCIKANIETSPPKVVEALTICQGKYFYDLRKDEITE